MLGRLAAIVTQLVCLEIDDFTHDVAPDEHGIFTPHVLSLMQDGRLEPKRLVPHRLHYSEMVQAYEMAYHREKNMLNVVFNWKDQT